MKHEKEGQLAPGGLAGEYKYGGLMVLGQISIACRVGGTPSRQASATSVSR
jgi:hypothetical protein